MAKTGKIASAVIRSRGLSAAEHESARRSIALLVDIHSSRTRVSKKARTSLSALESMVIGQLNVLQARALSSTSRKLSGASWVSEFPDSELTSALANGFRQACEKFIAAIEEAGASVKGISTYRPAERAYLMHYAWKIANGSIEAGDVPARDGVDIEWTHETAQQSVNAAKDMVQAYGIVKEPSLTSRHMQGRAIDMTISWVGTLSISSASGKVVEIAGEPRSGANAELQAVGKGYGVIKAVFNGDPPHWSDDGH